MSNKLIHYRRISIEKLMAYIRLNMIFHNRDISWHLDSKIPRLLIICYQKLFFLNTLSTVVSEIGYLVLIQQINADSQIPYSLNKVSTNLIWHIRISDCVKNRFWRRISGGHSVTRVIFRNLLWWASPENQKEGF